MFILRLTFTLCLTVFSCSTAWAEKNQITTRMHHLRAGAEREWSSFPATPEAKLLNVAFEAKSCAEPATLRLRQQDVKQTWKVVLNGVQLGKLIVDENDMVVYLDIPAGILVDGENRLRIEQAGETSDDIRVGEIWLECRSSEDLLNESMVSLKVVDGDSQQRLPCRITILNAVGALQTTGTSSNDHLAVRPGIVFTSRGEATFGLPAGSYRIIVGRGFEYSIDEEIISLAAGETAQSTLSIRREVTTAGYVACDPHVHTLTHSGHGDATIRERMITIAAEGIELPIATDHNAHIDYQPLAEEMNVRQYFTPVIGNEVTTRTGHFNIFPVAAGAKIPEHSSDEWKTTLDGIFATPNVKVAILNHARDLHGGTVPFGPRQFNDAIGENTAGWHMGFNAMEVVNSGATQTDALQLFRDWMMLLNHGYPVTPVGSSDSHDVGRHFVGQGRTYIRCRDEQPGTIDVNQAVANFVNGGVLVSYGLLTELRVNEQFQSGELATDTGNEITLDMRVLGPHWVHADKVMLFANGRLLREKAIPSNPGPRPGGVIWSEQWNLRKTNHDVHLVVIATGPGVDSLHWRTAKPYQPDGIDPSTNVLGCSGAVWIDADNDGRITPARGYAEQLVQQAAGNMDKLMQDLSGYDAAVAAQAAGLLQAAGRSLLDDEVQRPLDRADPLTQQGFKQFLDAWRDVQLSN